MGLLTQWVGVPHIVREFYQIFGKSGNKFLTKKFLRQYVCYGAYKHVSKYLIPIPLGEPVRNIYILKLMYFQCISRIPKIKLLQIWMKLGVNIVSDGVCMYLNF